MKETVKKDFFLNFVTLLFLLFSFWWFVLRFLNLPNDSIHNQIFAAVYGIIAIFGGLKGLSVAFKWGGLKSLLGKSALFFSLGLLLQEAGQLTYSYYIYFKKIEIPYPSIGDLFFYGTIPLYIAAVIYLAKASGVHISLRSVVSKLQAILIPLAMLSISYYVLLQDYIFDWSNKLVIFLDFGVPLGQAVYISIAILTYLLTTKMLGGLMRSKVLLFILALLAQYVADWTFLFQASQETWYAGGLNDYMYLVAYFLMTYALFQLNLVFRKLKEEGNS